MTKHNYQEQKKASAKCQRSLKDLVTKTRKSLSKYLRKLQER